MNEFNNFEVYVINDYSPLETNEIIVSTEERIILLLNHKFDITSGKSRYQKVNSISGELTNYVGYSVYTDSITGMSGAVICQKSNNISIPVEYYYTTEGE